MLQYFSIFPLLDLCYCHLSFTYLSHSQQIIIKHSFIFKIRFGSQEKMKYIHHVTFISRRSSFLIFFRLSFFPSHLKKMSSMFCQSAGDAWKVSLHSFLERYIYLVDEKAFSFSMLKILAHCLLTYIFSMRNKSSLSLILYIKCIMLST